MTTLTRVLLITALTLTGCSSVGDEADPPPKHSIYVEPQTAAEVTAGDGPIIGTALGIIDRDGLYVSNGNYLENSGPWPGFYRTGNAGPNCYWRSDDRDGEVVTGRGEGIHVLWLDLNGTLYTEGCGSWRLFAATNHRKVIYP